MLLCTAYLRWRDPWHGACSELTCVPPGSRFTCEAVEEINLEERLRGEFIHRVLYFVEDLENIEPELEQIIKRVNDELMTDYPVETMKRNLFEFLKKGRGR